MVSLMTIDTTPVRVTTHIRALPSSSLKHSMRYEPYFYDSNSDHVGNFVLLATVLLSFSTVIRYCDKSDFCSRVLWLQ